MEIVGKVDEFTLAYFEAALWSSMDNADDSGGSPLDTNYDYSDISEETAARMIDDCKRFQNSCADLLSLADEEREFGADYHGHDFWLTRNGHGAGFWDRGYSRELGEKLTAAARGFGEFDLYVEDDGKIYS